eukprot:gene11782-biopygen3239
MPILTGTSTRYNFNDKGFCDISSPPACVCRLGRNRVARPLSGPVAYGPGGGCNITNSRDNKPRHIRLPTGLSDTSSRQNAQRQAVERMCDV